MTPHSSLSRVQSLGLPQLAGRVPTYYLPDTHDRAAEIQSKLQDMADFCHRHLALDVDLGLALLGPQEWAAVTEEIPYGLPWVSGEPPYVTVLPATQDHALAALTRQVAARQPYGLDAERSLDHRVETFIALIGFHELGHVVTQRYGISAPTLWLNEVLASFVAYAYMTAQAPDWADLWQTICEGYIEAVEPQHTSLTDFEQLYAGVGGDNYVWYQGVFRVRVHAILQRSGLDFLRALKDVLGEANGQDSTDRLFLDALEQIVPGFHAWAHHYRLV